MPDYSPEQFYTHATDKKGHCVQVRVALPPNVMDMLGELVASKQIPEYKTVQHVLRDALYHRLRYMNEVYQPEALAPLSIWTVQIEAEKRLERQRAADDIVQKITETSYRSGPDEQPAVRKQIEDALTSDLPQSAKDRLRHLLG